MGRGNLFFRAVDLETGFYRRICNRYPGARIVTAHNAMMPPAAIAKARSFGAVGCRRRAP
jgi:hypothetical protein